MTHQVELTLGPVFFNWSTEKLSSFYARIADEADFSRVYMGEVVCGKRSPLLEAEQIKAAERLERAGKQVVWSTLISPANKRERKATASIAEFDSEIEVNDIGALKQRNGKAFTAGPMLNVYNELALSVLREEGCIRWCPPVELPIEAISAVHAAVDDIPIELFGYGRLPLAHSGRCYHARFHGLNKDSCQYVCEQDPDGKRVDTIDGDPFLAFNGLQSLSDAMQIATIGTDKLRDAGISAIRLSPHSVDMVQVARSFRGFLDGQMSPDELKAQLQDQVLGRPTVNGYLHAQAGMEWVAP